jgi:hypothetical protein
MSLSKNHGFLNILALAVTHTSPELTIVPYIPWTHYVSNIGYSISTIVAAEEIQS